MPFDVVIGRNESDKKAFGDRGLAFIGKSFVTMGNYTSLSNPIFMDVARSHVVLISGKRGSGKCLLGDTLISLDDGSLIEIQNLKNNKNDIYSLDNNLKIKAKPKSNFFSRNVKEIIKLRLRSGKEIKLTPEHPLFTVNGWKPVNDLKSGSRIATPRILPSFGKGRMLEYEVKLLSYLIAEGHTKSVVLFSNNDKKIVSDFEKALNKFDSDLKLVREKKGHFRISNPNYKTITKDSSRLKRNSKGQFVNDSKIQHEIRSIRKLLVREEVFGKLAIQKYLSQNILKLNKKLLKLFLNRLFSCDGSIYKSNKAWEISYSSSSKKLIRQVQNLLLRFGILSRLRDKKIKTNEKMFDTYELVIGSVNVLNYLRQIGFYGVKEIRASKAIDELANKEFNPNVDTIPIDVWENFKPESWVKIGQEFGYKYPKAMRERLRYCPSRNTLFKIANIEKNNKFLNLATSDIFWDQIVSMEKMRGSFEVYDLSVPETYNFVANDIIVHNSYTMGTMAESLSDLGVEESGNIASVIFDTMGIYWTMKYKNVKDEDLLDEWGLKAKNIPMKVFAPFGYYQEYKDKGVDVDSEFAIKISELEPSDWVTLFELKFTDTIAVVIESVISELRDSKSSYGFEDIYDLINRIENVEQEVKNSVTALFDAARTWKIFNEEKGTSVRDLISAGQTTVIDLSMYASLGSFNVRALIIGLVSKKIFNERMSSRKDEEIQAVQHGADYARYKVKRDMPLVWIFVDEAHEFIPREGKTPATDALVQLLREGRQPGVSIVMATQQPGKIHTDAMTQSDIVISHRVTAKLDVDALNDITQSYMYENISTKLNGLPKLKGSAIILDDNSERIYPMRIRPRFTWHGGEAPTAIRKIDEEIN